MDKDFDLALWKSQIKKKVVAIAAEDSNETLKTRLCIVDAKAFYDHLSKESTGPSADKRTGLEMQVVRQNMSGINAKIRWVPHPRVVVDCLTKKNANLEALDDLLDTGEYQIVSEAHALQRKRDQRESGAVTGDEAFVNTVPGAVISYICSTSRKHLLSPVGVWLPLLPLLCLSSLSCYAVYGCRRNKERICRAAG